MQEDSATLTNVNVKKQDLLDYMEIILKRKNMILKVTIPIFVLLLILSILSPSIYQSTTRILPPQQDQGLMSLMMGSSGLSNLAGSMLGTGTPADQYASILESERIKDSIIDRFKLMEEYDVEYRVKMYEQMDKFVKIKTGRRDGIITIDAQDKDPQKAADIANAYVEELGKLVAEMSMSDAGRNRGFLEVRLAQAKADLARAEDAMKSFQLKNKAINVPEQGRASIEGVALLKAQLAIQEAQLSALRSQFTDSTQEVRTLKATITNLRSQISRLEGMGTGAIPSVGSVPSLGQEQVRLLREFKIQEALVELLTKQYELAKFTEAKNINTIQVIQKAQKTDYLFKKKFRKRYVILLTFFAFAIAVFWTLFQDYRRRMPTAEAERWQNIISLIKER